jgi:CubicO group peptidase (beta-lactamase class C family)
MSPAFAMSDIESSVDRIAEETRFSGVVRADRGDDVLLCKAYGLAHRWGIANTIDTRFATASGTKGLTALTVMSLIEEDRLELGTTARSVLGDDLPLIEDAVTVEHLLAHRSGIGDYFDEEIERPKDAYILPIPIHELATTEPYVRVLDGFPTKFPPGERFSYSNSGYVVLALRVSGIPFHDLVV